MLPSTAARSKREEEKKRKFSVAQHSLKGAVPARRCAAELMAAPATAPRDVIAHYPHPINTVAVDCTGEFAALGGYAVLL